MRTFQITAMAETWVEADTFEEAIQKSPDIGDDWDISYDEDNEEEEDGNFRITALIETRVLAKNAEDAFAKMPYWNTAWNLDNFEVNKW